MDKDYWDVDSTLEEIIVEKGIRKPEERRSRRLQEDDQVGPMGRGNQGSTKTVRFQEVDSLDPLNTSLEDMIRARNGRLGDRGQKRGTLGGEGASVMEKRRAKFAAANSLEPPKRKKLEMEVVATPKALEWEKEFPRKESRLITVPRQELQRFTAWRAVGFLCEEGLLIEAEIGRQAEPERKDPARLWRCRITCGAVIGIAESFRKVVAREMASDDFLKKLRSVYVDVTIPEYEIYEELFIDPRIFRQIMKKGSERRMEVNHTVKVRAEPIRIKYKSYYQFVCIYTVGKKKFKEESYIEEFAKLRAAKMVYEFLFGTALPKTRYFCGPECDLAEEYNVVETEVYQIAELHEGIEELL